MWEKGEEGNGGARSKLPSSSREKGGENSKKFSHKIEQRYGIKAWKKPETRRKKTFPLLLRMFMVDILHPPRKEGKEGCSIRLSAEKGKERGEERGEGE